MANEQEFSVKGPIAKLALQHGQDAVRHVVGKKPKSVDISQARALVDKGAYSWCRYAPKHWYHDEGDVDRWRIGAEGGGDFVEFMAPPHEALSKLREIAQAAGNPAKPAKAMVKKMFDAIGKKNLEEVRRLAPYVANAPQDGRLPLHLACRYNQTEIVAALLPHADPNAVEEASGKTALMVSLHRQDRCAGLLLPVSDLTVKGAGGRTLLMVYAEAGWTTQAVHDAIFAACDPMAADEDGWTALMFAVAACDPNAVEELLPICDPAAKNKEGHDALAIALIEAGKPDRYPRRDVHTMERCVKPLLDHCDLRWRDQEGNTVPMLLTKRGMRALLEKFEDDAALQERDGSGDTPLIAAARQGNHQTVESLLPRSDPNARGAGGDTALIAAARRCDVSMVRLLRKASDPDAQNDAGRTALMETLLAAPTGSYQEKTEIAVYRCALQLMPATDLSLQDAQGRTALMHCLNPSLLEIFELMLPNADVNAQDCEGATALMLCADEPGSRSRSGLGEFAQLLVPRSDARIRDSAGRTALMRHVRHPWMVRSLLDGSEIDAQDGEGRTALMHALGNGYSTVEASIELLLPRSDARLQDKRGKTAGDLAREQGDEAIAADIEARIFELDVPRPPRDPAPTLAPKKKHKGL